jgi:ubiquinone/menaquinone biosynthesis C-methylase UbiE
VNKGHVWCGSDQWRTIVRDTIVPWALADCDLGADVLEVGPGYGATTDVFRERVDRLTAVEIDTELAATLSERFVDTNVVVVLGDASSLTFDDDRFTGATSFHMLHHVPSTALQDRIFAEVARVVRPGGVFVAADGVYSPESATFHAGDTYVPIDPATLTARLGSRGFTDVEVEVDPARFGWVARARVAAPA